MRKLLSLTVMAALVLGVATSANALGIKKGVKLGVGTSSFDLPDGTPEPDDYSPFAIGGALVLELPVITVEADLMYRSFNSDETRLGIPVLAKVGLLPLPLVNLSLGAGLEPRWALSTEAPDGTTEDMVWYLPVALEGSFDLQVVKVGAEIRYEYQLTNETKSDFGGDDIRHHQLMFYGGVFF
ncbi:MAG: hypothetical protein ACE366_09745 [Bradymonadia bacterium]